MKKKRLKKILELILEYEISTQDELMLLLRSNGFEVTQATVSRDIKELRLIKKKNANGISCYIDPNSLSEDSAKFSNIFISTVKSVDFAQNIVVLKCTTGMAQAACAALDSMSHSHIIGTIAGDDTVIAITKTETEAKLLTEDINSVINM